MPAVAEPVLIVALSGRALAQSARAAGFAPIVLDAFADLDTRAVAQVWRQVPVDRRWRLRRAPLLTAAATLAPPPVPLVWGSGFEGRTDLLAEIARNRPLWGTTPAAVRAIKDPIGFAQAVGDLGFAHPETRARPPAKAPGWLVKRGAAAGGGHVRAAHLRGPHGRGWYWQRRMPGRPVSALLVADGRRACVLGFSEQWAAPGPGRRFRFAGVAAPAALSPAARATLAAAAAALAVRYEVRGLASVDALVDRDRVVVLEVNPRPGASLDACERCYGVNLFALHRSACAGELPEPPQPVGAAGSAILYAPRALQVPDGFTWPAWTADRTPPGVRVPARGPVCTLRAAGTGTETVRTALLERQAMLLERLVGVRRAARRRSSAESPNRDAGRAIGRPGTAR